MDTLQNMRAFVCVAETGSFTAASRLRRGSRGRSQRCPCPSRRQAEAAFDDRHRPALRDPCHRRLPPAVPRRDLRPDHGQPRAGPARRGLRRGHRGGLRATRFRLHFPAHRRDLQHSLRLAGVPAPERHAERAFGAGQPRLPTAGQPGGAAGSLAVRRPQRPGNGLHRRLAVPGQCRRRHDRGNPLRAGHRHPAGVFGHRGPAQWRAPARRFDGGGMVGAFAPACRVPS